MEDFVSLCALFWVFPRTFVQGRTKEIKDIYILRRTKDDLAKINERLRLPPCIFENVELDMFPEEKALYECVFLEAQEYYSRRVQKCPEYLTLKIWSFWSAFSVPGSV